MPQIYTTIQGETVDLACWRHYGRTATVTQMVLAANPGLAAKGAELPMGTQILMPDWQEATSARPLVSLWD